MFTLMIRANGVTIVIAGTADSREGVYLILVIIITDGTITAIGTPEGTLFAAETAVGSYKRVNRVVGGEIKTRENDEERGVHPTRSSA